MLTRQLREYRDTLQTESAALEGSLPDSDFVFCQVNDNPRDERSVQRGFGRVLRIAGLPHTRFHDPRYTHAPLLLKAGVHPKAVGESLGHGSVSFTLGG
ncbi:MAG: tyrosine-type recombinase/integrase, partial [Chloroflexi bacterium]|nr:tyrosine-type recombinase/integrase [Chloroflexota bacterium]